MSRVTRLLMGLPLLFVMTAVIMVPATPLFAAERPYTLEQAYIASKHGEKYHLHSCRMAKRIKNENRVSYASVSDAQMAGKTPCRICKP